jgi:hypothetical protein
MNINDLSDLELETLMEGISDTSQVLKYTTEEKTQIYNVKHIMSLMNIQKNQSILTEIHNLLARYQIQLKLTEQLYKVLPQNKTIISIPVYAKEANLDKLINTIKQQQ